MADLKVFVSSTCYDLSIIREQLKKFIEQMGYTSILSEYSDVLYDPREHTHTSCVQEVNNIDILILIIGSRFGGKAVPEALTKINFDKLKDLSSCPVTLEDDLNLSITQTEVLKAIELEIPIYVFVDEKVKHEHFIYTKNKTLVDTMNFPSIDKQESAKYIFNFIDFLSHRVNNNNIMTYSRLEDIESQLKKQWGSYFQRLLKEQTVAEFENKNFNSLSDQINDIKAALLSTLSNDEAKTIARGTIRFRRLVDSLMSLNISKKSALNSNLSFLELLQSVNIKTLLVLEEKRNMRNNFIFIKNDKKIISSRFSLNMVLDIKNDWIDFIQLNQDYKEVIFDTLVDMSATNRGLRIFYDRNQTLKEYLKENVEPDEKEDIKKSIKPIEDIFDA